jgi:hypothetical protein
VNSDRRTFLQQFASICGSGIARTLGAGTLAATAGSAAAKTYPAKHIHIPIEGTGVRAQVFEVIVRQALSGAPWREICAGPMEVNNICPQQVEAAVRLRRAETHTGTEDCRCQKCKQIRQGRRERANQAVAAIGHSEQSACPCVKCRDEASRLAQLIWKEAFELDT